MAEYPYPLYDEKGKVVCQVCGKPYLVISPKHLETHNIKYLDYTKRFPDAPLSNKEFAARGRYGKMKDMFIHPENEVIDEDEPEIEELTDVEEFTQREMPITDPITAMKMRIRNHLKMHFTNIKMDYLIRQFGIDNRLKLEFITDFCDPILKVVIQFPDTFWHNRDLLIDLNKNLKLEKYGWKVITIKSSCPTPAKINAALDDI